MMSDVYVLNPQFEKIGIIDSYKSLIWANRYNEIGDCEIYVAATTENFQLLQKGHYVYRLDDDMICRIKKLEIDTSVQDGNYIIATGYDVKQWLDQRVVWNTTTADGTKVETFARKLVNQSLVNPTNTARQIKDGNGNSVFKLDAAAGFDERISEQVSFKNVGEKVREYCKKYNWGYKVIRKNDGFFYFQLYKGTDRRNTVLFSEEYENLSTSKFVSDSTKLENVSLVAGTGEGSERPRAIIGDYSGADRNELFVDAKDISKKINWKDLIELYPDTDHGGQGHIETAPGNLGVYVMNSLYVQIINDEHEAELIRDYPQGQVVIESGIKYYYLTNIVIATLPNSSPSDNDSVALEDIIYTAYLYTRGEVKLAERKTSTSFEGTINPSTTFLYKRDYFLGDLVTIKNQYGISVTARIVEVVEVNDDKGYNIEPKLEYNSTI